MRWADFLNYASQLSFKEYQTRYQLPAIITALSEDSTSKHVHSIGKPTRVSLLPHNSHGFESNQIHFLKEGSTLLGRDFNCDIIYVSDEVSRNHAKFRYLEVCGGRWTIIDCCSKNGTYVNDHRVRIIPQCLEDCDTIRLGQSINLIFRTPVGLWEAIELARKQMLEECTI